MPAPILLVGANGEKEGIPVARKISFFNKTKRFHSLFLGMHSKIKLLLFLSVMVSLSTNAQRYEEQHAICSAAINQLGEVDSLYFALVKKRDSCLAGTDAPDFTATTIKGNKIELSKLRGKVVVLNFWFTRCGPCIGEMPDLNKVVAAYKDKNVEFISFSFEKKEVLEAFLTKQPFSFDVVAESEDISRETFKLFSAWPYFIVIDTEGKVNRMWFGASENVAAELKKLIDGLLY
jgi:peroxiredoxin